MRCSAHTIERSDFSGPRIIGFDSSSSRCGPPETTEAAGLEISRFPSKERLCMPGSKTTQGRPGTRKIAPVRIAFRHANGVGTLNDLKLSRLNGWPTVSPVNASPCTSRCTTHDSGPVWFAIPSLHRTFTCYSLPVSRRTSVRFLTFGVDPSNSTVVVLAIDSNSNQLTVQTSAGDEVTYSPHLTKAMTSQSTIYREEQREIAIGERIQLNETISTKGVRKGDFATVTAISESNDLEVRTDKGSKIRLDPQESRHIEHGYAVRASEQVLTNAFSSPRKISAGQEFASLARNAREVSIYTSDGLGLGRTQMSQAKFLNNLKSKLRQTSLRRSQCMSSIDEASGVKRGGH